MSSSEAHIEAEGQTKAEGHIELKSHIEPESQIKQEIHCGLPHSGRRAHVLSVSAAGLMLAVLLFTGCDRSDQEAVDDSLQTRIHGRITVDEALDDTSDYSGISLLVLGHSDEADTVFRSVTNRNGEFDGTARFPRADSYQLEVFRREDRIDDTTLILAPGDTVRIEGEIPRFSGHAQIISVENEAMQTVNRLERQFNRILGIASVGGIPQDTIPYMLDQWSDIFWQVFEQQPETVAAQVAARESLRMLEGRNDEKLMQRINDFGDHETIRRLAAQFGFVTVIRRDGLDAGISWIDSLAAQSTARQTRRQIAMNLIEVLYDSARTAEAQRRFNDFESEFGEDSGVENWLEIIRYDIKHLSAGQDLPSFDVELFENDTLRTLRNDTLQTIRLEDLQGTPAMIEVVSLSDRSYQMSYNELRTIHQIYREEGIRFLTIPVEENTVAVEAFFDERGQDWPVARAGAYAESDLEETWNIYETPVRFLIDNEGRIIRKFHGNNLNELLIEVNKSLTNGEVL